MGQARPHIFIQTKVGKNLFSSGVTGPGSRHLVAVCGHEALLLHGEHSSVAVEDETARIIN